MSKLREIENCQYSRLLHGEHPASQASDTAWDPECDPALLSLRLRKVVRTNVGLTVTLCLLLAGLLPAVWKVAKGPSQLQCAKLNSPWSPAWDGIEFWEGDFENDFPHHTKYRGPASPEIDKAWTDLWRHDGISVSAEGVRALNKTERPWIRNDDGTGYVGMLEVFHQLHWLDLIRKYTWLNLYTDETIPSSFREPVEARMHVDHCIETLRLSLMCYADVTPMLTYYDPESPIGYSADFNVHHKCRSFDKLVDYVHRPA